MVELSQAQPRAQTGPRCQTEMCFYSNNIHNPPRLRLSVVCVYIETTLLCAVHQKEIAGALGALAA